MGNTFRKMFDRLLFGNQEMRVRVATLSNDTTRAAEHQQQSRKAPVCLTGRVRGTLAVYEMVVTKPLRRLSCSASMQLAKPRFSTSYT